MSKADGAVRPEAALRSFCSAKAKEGDSLYYVYLIQSINSPEQRYIGSTGDLKARFKAHNAGESKHTSKFCPWELIVYHAFKEKRKAQEFEYYLKTGSGRAFANKRFW